MNWQTAWLFARRELRGGIAGFKVFLACLIIGVATIAAIGSVRESINSALAREGAVLLGGDAEIELTYRFADPDEQRWMQNIADQVSEIVDFRSMVQTGGGDTIQSALTQIKGVDGNYPLYGQIILEPDIPLADALAGNGAVMDRLLVDRFGLRPGDRFRLGTKEFHLSAVLVREPDSSGGFSLGPRTIVLRKALEGTGLLGPGTLFDSAYRLKFSEPQDFDALKVDADKAIRSGGRWRDSRNGAPGTQRFVERLSSFLVLVGLAGLITGGVGISSAITAFVDTKIPTIATLRSLGANSGFVFKLYFLQITCLAVLGVSIGAVFGAALPFALAPIVEGFLPVQPDLKIYPLALLQATVFGLLSAAIFAIWPLSRTQGIRAATMFREAAFGLSGAPQPRWIALCFALVFLFISYAISYTGQMAMTLWSAAGLLLAFGVLVLAGRFVRSFARLLSRRLRPNGATSLRQALVALGGPGSETRVVVLSLGLGLSVLAAIGQIDRNLKNAISAELPDIAPSFFFVDIQSDQINAFKDRLAGDAGVSKFETAPMLRGMITRINGQDAVEAVGRHWVLSGDRGITFSDAPQENAIVTDGEWWPMDYSGEPQISFAANEAQEMGLVLGDRMTVNILGRDVTGTITSFRDVDFSDAGMGFILSMNPSALRAAPHTYISTVYSQLSAEAAIVRDMALLFPNVTVIGVRDAINRAAGVLQAVSGAITYGAMVALLTGGIVLIGATAAGQRARRYEAAVLKSIGAQRRQILVNFALRTLIMGIAAGVVATMVGALFGWAVINYTMELEYRFDPLSAAIVIAAGAALTIGSGAIFVSRATAAKPAAILRSNE